MATMDYALQINANDKLGTNTLFDALVELQDEALANGLSNMTLVEINAEIAASRQEKRGF